MGGGAGAIGKVQGWEGEMAGQLYCLLAWFQQSRRARDVRRRQDMLLVWFARRPVLEGWRAARSGRDVRLVVGWPTPVGGWRRLVCGHAGCSSRGDALRRGLTIGVARGAGKEIYMVRQGKQLGF